MKRDRTGNSSRTIKVAIDSLGCKLNQAETELLARQFAEAGYRLVAPTDKADAYILNTCTVTHTADSKSRHQLRLAHHRNPDALIVATGCYAELARQGLEQIEGVDLVVGNEQKPHLVRLLKESGRLDKPAPGNSTGCHHNGFRTRSFIKVQDGCSSFCAYCIVPLVRGRETSLPPDQITAELRHRLARGYKEVVLTGVKIGAYSYDGVNLKGLLEHILAETNVARVRLSSLQPQEISPELIGLWQDRRLCPHFHLSLQSGSDRVLNRMNRRYTTSDYSKSASLIRRLVPEAAITTDIIVGFPGETDREFEESYNFCRQMAFARIHVFTYSPREGTQAAQLPEQIPAGIKKQRRQRMLALAEDSARSFHQQFLCQLMPVLWEKQSDGIWSGYTPNYIRVYTTSSQDLTNTLLPAKLMKIYRDGVWGGIMD